MSTPHFFIYHRFYKFDIINIRLLQWKDHYSRNMSYKFTTILDKITFYFYNSIFKIPSSKKSIIIIIDIYRFSTHYWNMTTWC